MRSRITRAIRGARQERGRTRCGSRWSRCSEGARGTNPGIGRILKRRGRGEGPQRERRRRVLRGAADDREGERAIGDWAIGRSKEEKRVLRCLSGRQFLEGRGFSSAALRYRLAVRSVRPVQVVPF